MSVACAIDHDVETQCHSSWRTHCNQDAGQFVMTIEGTRGQPITLTKYIAYHTSHTPAPEEMCARAERSLDRAVGYGFSHLLKEQGQYMDDFWARSDLQVVEAVGAKRSTIEVQQAIRFNLFHILQATARAEGSGMPAKGLTGQAYDGHYFWDTEIYVLPFLIYTAPHIAKNLLRFRHRLLDKARERARQLNQKGAMYPWRTINGEEASAYYAAGTAQYHINADIMYGLKKYVQATGDEDFLFHEGAEMLVETARLWSHLGFYCEHRGGQFCLDSVTGPDEYNVMVDNNTYTNLMARENLRYAAATVQALGVRRPDLFTALLHKTRLDLAEVEEWKRAAERMYVPYDEELGINAQDDDFLQRQRWDFELTPPEKHPLLLFFHPLTIYRYQVIKQPDLVLAMFLLGHEFSGEMKKRNFEYYDPLTTADSSLAPCIQSIMAAEIGDLKRAEEYADVAMRIDLEDIAGNLKDGCHLAAMAGVWMLYVYGFAGLRDYDGCLSFRPRLPETLERLRFSLIFRDHVLEVDASRHSTRYRLCQGSRLSIRHEDEEIQLSSERPFAVGAILH